MKGEHLIRSTYKFIQMHNARVILTYTLELTEKNILRKLVTLFQSKPLEK